MRPILAAAVCTAIAYLDGYSAGARAATELVNEATSNARVATQLAEHCVTSLHGYAATVAADITPRWRRAVW